MIQKTYNLTQRSSASLGARLSFTLVEMLVVILVIAILISMLFPVVLKSREWGREKQAMMEIKNIEMALKAYHAVYGEWPNQSQDITDTCYALNNAAVIAALIGDNPRAMVFLQAQQTALSNSSFPGSYIDPWGRPYAIIMDEDGDNQVAVTADGKPATTPPNTLTLPLTNQTGKIMTNYLHFSGNFRAGVWSWGSQNSALKYTNGVEYLNMDLSSWRTGEKTK